MSMRVQRVAPAVLGLACGAVALAGCGSTSGSTTLQPGAAASSAASTAASATPSSTASAGAAASIDPQAAAKITECNTGSLGVPHAMVSLSNRTDHRVSYDVAVSFTKGGKQLFDGSNLDDELAAGQTRTFLVVGQPADASKVPASFACHIASVTAGQPAS